MGRYLSSLQKNVWMEIGFEMDNFFSIDNKFFTAMGKVADMLMINIAFVITVFLGIGPACTALYYSIMKNVRRSRSYALKEYFRSFRQNFLQGLLCGVIQLVMIYLLFQCYHLAMAMDPKSTFGQIYYAGTFVIIVLFLCISIYLYPLLSRFTLKTGTLIKMAFVLSLRNFYYTIGLLILVVAGALGIYLIPPLVLIVPAIYTLFSTFLLEPVFRKYSPKDQESSNVVDPWWLDDGKNR